MLSQMPNFEDQIEDQIVDAWRSMRTPSDVAIAIKGRAGHIEFMLRETTSETRVLPHEIKLVRGIAANLRLGDLRNDKTENTALYAEVIHQMDMKYPGAGRKIMDALEELADREQMLVLYTEYRRYSPAGKVAYAASAPRVADAHP